MCINFYYANGITGTVKQLRAGTNLVKTPIYSTGCGTELPKPRRLPVVSKHFGQTRPQSKVMPPPA